LPKTWAVQSRWCNADRLKHHRRPKKSERGLGACTACRVFCFCILVNFLKREEIRRRWRSLRTKDLFDFAALRHNTRHFDAVLPHRLLIKVVTVRLHCFIVCQGSLSLRHVGRELRLFCFIARKWLQTTERSGRGLVLARCFTRFLRNFKILDWRRLSFVRCLHLCVNKYIDDA
jgi:hypothetical protein